MVKCLKDNIQNPNHVVPTWTWGGEPTRDALKQKEFLENQGFRFKWNCSSSLWLPKLIVLKKFYYLIIK